MNNNLPNIELPKSWKMQLEKGSQDDLISKPLNFIRDELKKGKNNIRRITPKEALLLQGFNKKFIEKRIISICDYLNINKTLEIFLNYL